MVWFALNEPICRHPAVNTCSNGCNASYPPTLLFTSKRPSLKKRAWEFGCMMKICKQNHILYRSIYSNCYCQGKKASLNDKQTCSILRPATFERERATSLPHKVKNDKCVPFQCWQSWKMFICFSEAEGKSMAELSNDFLLAPPQWLHSRYQLCILGSECLQIETSSKWLQNNSAPHLWAMIHPFKGHNIFIDTVHLPPWLLLPDVALHKLIFLKHNSWILKMYFTVVNSARQNQLPFPPF